MERVTPTSRRPLRTSDEQTAKGLRCRKCYGTLFDVLRTVKQEGFVIRRRECVHCKARVTTREVVISDK